MRLLYHPAKKMVALMLGVILLLVTGGVLLSINPYHPNANGITGAVVGPDLTAGSLLEQEYLEEVLPLGEVLLFSDSDESDFGVMNSANATQCGGVNQSITLTRNINATGNCFIVNASNVIIDGASFFVQGNGSGTGVNSTNFTNITIKNIKLLNFSVGVYFENTNRSTIYNVSIQNSTIGIYLSVGSELNNISSNRLVNNTLLGILIQNSNNNIIYNNYFVNNSNHANDNATNRWNITPSCDLTTRPDEGYINIIGGPCLGGNFFDNYTQTVNTFDGLGSTVYFIPGGSNNDSLPLETNTSIACKNVTVNTNFSTPYGPVTIIGASTSNNYGCIIAGLENITLDGQGAKIIQRIAEKTSGVFGFGIQVFANNVTIKNFVVDGWSVGMPLNASYTRTNAVINNLTIKNMNSSWLDYAFSFTGNNSRVSNLTITNLTSEVFAIGLFHNGTSQPNTFTNINISNVYGGFVLLDVFNNTFDNVTFYNISNYFIYEYRCSTEIVTSGVCKNTFISLRNFDNHDIRYKTNNKAGKEGPYQFDIAHRVRVNVTNTTGSGLSNVTVEGVSILYRQFGDVQLTDEDGIATLILPANTIFAGIDRIISAYTLTTSKENYTATRFQDGSINLLLNNSLFYNNISMRLLTCAGAINSSVVFGGDFNCANSGFGFDLLINTAGSGRIIVEGGNYTLFGSTGTGLNIINTFQIRINNLRIFNFSDVGANGMSLLNNNHGEFRNIILSNNTIGMTLDNSNNNTFYELRITNSTAHSILANGTGTNNIVNASVMIDNVTVQDSAKIARKWYVTVNVTFNGGIPLPNANVYGTSVPFQQLENSGTTDNEGLIRLELTELEKSTSGNSYSTPHNISMNFTSSGGVVGNSTIINLSITNSTYVNFSVTLNCTAPKNDLNVTNNTVLCPGIYNIDDEGDTGVIIFNVSNVKLTCDQTQFINKKDRDAGTGIFAANKRNITIADCTFENYHYGIAFNDVNNSLINNTILRSMGSSGISFQDSFHNAISFSQFLNSGSASQYGLLLKGS
ncbi:hypothetical protein HYX13_04635, partial [Candidatus Woesearchaeota archaeon]|nr:hypothetical protein [Candidatus Woesearchaeota archaeon]